MIKNRWSKRLSCTHHALRATDLSNYVQEVVDEIAATLDHRIMNVADRAYLEVEAGKLV